MATIAGHLELRGLGKQKMTALAQKAKRLGVSPARYVRQLVEHDLAMDEDTQTASFSKSKAPVRAEFEASGMNEKELDSIVNAARARHRDRISSKRKKR